MHDSLKTALGTAVILTLAVFAYSSLRYVDSYSRSIDPSSQRSFSVSARGESSAVPDVARFSAAVLTEGGTDLQGLQQENTDAMNALIAFVRAEGVAKEDVKTQNYSIQPRYQYFSCPEEGGVCPPPEIVGYTVRQSLQVTVRDFAAVGGLLSGAVENGANTVSQLSFTVDDPTEVENEARAEAIRKAQEKAAAIAEAGGFTMGKLLSIQEGSSSIPPIYLPEEFARTEDAPVIEPGSQEVAVQVTLTYEIR